MKVPQSYLDHLSIADRECSWTKVFADPRNKMLVAEDNGRMVGFSSFGPSRDGGAGAEVGELYAIYLLEGSKGQGIGTSLWYETRKCLQLLGYQQVSLWVLETNLQGRKFYEKMGFILDGTEKSAEIDGQKVIEVRYQAKIG